MKTALQIYQERKQEDMKRHVERVEWLSQPSPKWSCGTPVDAFYRKVLLDQSVAFVEQNRGAA